MNRLIIVGASGHGKVCADIAKKNGYTDIVFLDDNEKLDHCGDYPVIGRSFDAPSLDGDLFVGIGNSEIRRRIMADLGQCVTLIHPSAVIADDVEIGEGTVVMAGTVINSGVRIGKGCIINTSSSVDHDCFLESFVHVSVGAHICGTVKIGEEAWIGAGATVINNVDIAEKCIIGAGAVIIKNVINPGIYIGVPAKMKTDK